MKIHKKSVGYHYEFGNYQNPRQVNFLKKLKPITGAGIGLLIEILCRCRVGNNKLIANGAH